jgi:YD repeat-containing protein
LKHVDDALNWRFDRLNQFDHQGRLQYAKSSSEANGTEITSGSEQLLNLPYRQTHTYNAFGDMTERYSKLWGADVNLTTSYTFTNHRISGWTYDADGRVLQQTTPEPLAEFEYNSAGQFVLKHDKREPTDHEDKYQSFYNGDGRDVKRVTEQCRKLIPNPPEEPPEDCSWWGEAASYMLRSTVMGGEVVSTAGQSGYRAGRFVLTPSGEKLADLSHRYTWNPDTTHEAAQFHHVDPAGFSQRVTGNYPEALLGQPSWDPNYIDPRQHEYEPGGANVGIVTNYVQQPAPPSDPMVPIDGDAYIFADGQWGRVYLDGLPINRQAVRMMGSALTYAGFPVESINGRLAIARSVTLRWDFPRRTESLDEFLMGVRLVATVREWDFLERPQPAGGPRLFGFSAEQRTKLLNALNDLAGNNECYGAFVIGGVTPIAKQIAEGLTVVEKLFVQNSANDRWWVPEGGEALAANMRQAYVDNENWLGISKTNDIAAVGPQHGGGRYFSLPNRAFDAIDEHFMVVLVHSLIHTGGQPGRATHFTGRHERPMPRVGTGGGPIYERSIHDLEWLGEKYNKIIKSCTGLDPRSGPARER